MPGEQFHRDIYPYSILSISFEKNAILAIHKRMTYPACHEESLPLFMQKAIIASQGNSFMVKLLLLINELISDYLNE